MLSKAVRRLVLVFIIVAVVLLTGCQNTQEYRIHAQQCERVFDCTPKQLLKSEHDCLDTVGDFRKKSYVDRNGNLVLVLTESQKKAMIEWLVEFPEIKDRTDVDVSEDLSSITIYYLPETFTEDSIEFAGMSRAISSVAAKIVTKKALEGVPMEDISILYTAKHIETGEVIYTETWKPTLVEK